MHVTNKKRNEVWKCEMGNVMIWGRFWVHHALLLLIFLWFLTLMIHLNCWYIDNLLEGPFLATLSSSSPSSCTILLISRSHCLFLYFYMCSERELINEMKWSWQEFSGSDWYMYLSRTKRVRRHAIFNYIELQSVSRIQCNEKLVS